MNAPVNSISAEQQARLPECVSVDDIFVWGQQRYRWQAHLGGESFPELEKHLAGVQQSLRGEVAVDIRWLSDSPGAVQAAGTVRLTLAGSCQKCLEPMESAQKLDIGWLLVAPERENDRMEGLETIVAEGESASPTKLLEEELLMEINPLLVHSDSCVEIGEAEAHYQPFANLRAMLKTSLEK